MNVRDGSHRPAFAVLLIAVAGVACGPGAADTDHGPLLDALPEIRLVEELRLGSVDDPERSFSRIPLNLHRRALAVDGTEHLYVFDVASRDVRRYDPDGRLLNRFGRIGEGPGEFRWPVDIGVVGDTLWTLEYGGGAGRRLTFFSPEGEVLGTTGLELPFVFLAGGLVSYLAPQFLTEEGLFISGDVSTYRRDPDLEVPRLEATDSIRIPRVRFTLRGEVVDTVGFHVRAAHIGTTAPREASVVEVGSSLFRVPLPPADDPVLLALPDGRVLVERRAPTGEGIATVRVTRTDVAGDTLFHRELAYRPAPLASSVLEQAAASASRTPRVRLEGGTLAYSSDPRALEDSAEARRRIRAAMDFPPFPPPISSVWRAQGGRIWLRREDDGSPGSRWIVLDPDGAPVGRVTLPGRMQPAWSRGDLLWAVDTDELGLQWLVRYRLHVPDGAEAPPARGQT